MADGQRTDDRAAAVPHQAEAQLHVKLALILAHRAGREYLLPVLGLAAEVG